MASAALRVRASLGTRGRGAEGEGERGRGVKSYYHPARRRYSFALLFLARATLKLPGLATASVTRNPLVDLRVAQSVRQFF